MGSNLILKERSIEPPNFESLNIRFLAERTSIPIPQIVEEWHEDNGTYFLLTKRIQGQPLSEIWPTMSETDKERVAKQTADFHRAEVPMKDEQRLGPYNRIFAQCMAFYRSAPLSEFVQRLR